MRLTRTCLLVSALSLLAACGSPIPPQDASVAEDFFSGGSAFADFRTSYDLRVFELINSCMRQNGFPDWDTQLGFTQSTEKTTAPTEPVELFGIVDGLEAVKNAPPEPEIDIVDISPEERDALDQVLNSPEQGCSAKAEAEARIEFRIDELEEIEAMSEELSEESGLGRSYLKRVEEWSRCMALQGISITRPEDIQNTVMESWLREQESRNIGQALELERTIFNANEQCPDPSLKEMPTEIADRLIEENRDFAEFLKESSNT